MRRAEPTIRESILAAYEELPPGERKLADSILPRLGSLASYSATELARDATVSKATAARFFRRIGYESYAQARQHARAETLSASPLRALAGAGRDPDADPVARHLATELKNLSESFRELDRRALAAAVRLLAKAPRVHVVGLRNGQFIAAHASSLLGQARDGVCSIPGAGVALAEDLVSLHRGDVLLVVDFRRRSALLASVIDAAREAGARLVFLSSPTLRPLARPGEVALHCLTDGPSLFDSYVAALSIVNYLCAAVATELGRASRKRLEAIEALHESLGDIRA